MYAHSVNMIIEPGMRAEMAAISDPVTNSQSAEQLNNIFKATFGVDLKKMECLNFGYLKVDKIG